MTCSYLPEASPEGTGRRRVDITTKYLGFDGEITLLALHEAKPLAARPSDVGDFEEQAINACQRYLEAHAELEFVFAITSIGTKGKAWTLDRDPIL